MIAASKLSGITNPDAGRYLRRGLRTVDGWLLPGAARLIAETASLQAKLHVTGNVAEIGVHEGKLFILLCLVRNGVEEAVAIDVFERQDLNLDRSGRGSKEYLQKNLLRHARLGKAPIIICADSHSISSDRLISETGGRFRLISIDGGHQAETVYHDLEVSARALCDGGCIILDDYFNEGWPGVADGTNRFFANGAFPQLTPFAIAQNKVFIGTRDYVDQYRDALTTAIGDDAKIRKSTLFGQPVSYFDFRFGNTELLFLRTLRSFLQRHSGAARILRRIRESL